VKLFAWSWYIFLT